MKLHRSTRALLCLEAVETQNRSSALRLGARLERNFASRTALCAGRREHLPRGIAFLLALVATVLAPLWCSETALCVESLLTLGERKGCAAIAACDLLISHKKERKKEVNCTRSFFSSFFGIVFRGSDYSREVVLRSHSIPFMRFRQ